MLLVAGLVFGGALLSQAAQTAQNPERDLPEQKQTGSKKAIDVRAKTTYIDRKLNASLGIGDQSMILVGDVAFHHNGTVISCDSAVQFSDNHIECFENVIINKDSTFVYGESAEYDGNFDLATVKSPVIKVVDGDATLYTTNFTFNTATNIGKWSGGGVMYQKSNMLESEVGYLYSDLNEMVAVHSVEMRNESHRLISDSVRYNTDTEVATFYTKTYIWTNEGEIITADNGRYNSRDSTYFFWRDSYIIDEFRETWADTIDFDARLENAVFYGNIQIDDNENESSAFGDLGQYWGERGETMLTRRPSLLNYNADKGNSDTLYTRADTVWMFVRYPSDSHRPDTSVDGGEGTTADTFEDLKWIDSLTEEARTDMADSLASVLGEIRGEIAGLDAEADSIMNALYPTPVEAMTDSVDTADSVDMTPSVDTMASYDTVPSVDTLPTDVNIEPIANSEPEPIEVFELRERRSELAARADSLRRVESYIRRTLTPAAESTPALDSLALSRLDSLSRADSLARLDSISARMDSLRVADPKAYKEYRKAEKNRIKAERKRLRYERLEAKYEAKLAKKEEKQRLRREKRAAKEAARAEKKAERQRLADAKRGWITETIEADSIARVDSMLARDSLMRPLLDSLERIDSLPPPSDSLAPQVDTTMRIFRGWRNVKIWRTDMQAVADSMVGFSTDSTMHLYIDPVLWNGDSQITADSITVFTANQALEHIEYFGDPIMSAHLDVFSEDQFNQVKGKEMSSWFRDGVLHRHDTYGNAEALYYVQERQDSAAVAFLSMTADNMSFLFADDSLRYIVAREETVWPIYPLDQIPLTQMTELQGFEWRPEIRPELKDVFDRHMRPSERTFHEELPRPEFPIASRIERRREYLISNRMWVDRNEPLPAYAEEFRRERFREEPR